MDDGSKWFENNSDACVEKNTLCTVQLDNWNDWVQAQQVKRLFFLDYVSVARVAEAVNFTLNLMILNQKWSQMISTLLQW